MKNNMIKQQQKHILGWQRLVVIRDVFAPGMVWDGVIFFFGKTSLIFIDNGAKVNADYYINTALKLFFFFFFFFFCERCPRVILRSRMDMVFPSRKHTCIILTP